MSHGMLRLPTRRLLYKEVWNHYGEQKQFNQLMEECAELIIATNKYARKGYSDHDCSMKLAEEIADVEIMIEQVKLMRDYDILSSKVLHAKEHKLNRLSKHMAEIRKKEKEE